MKKKKPSGVPDKRTANEHKLKKLRNDLSVFSEAHPVARQIFSRVDLIMLFLSAVILLTLAITGTPQRRGDGNEYFQMLISLSGHASPELRESDLQEFNRLRDIAAESSLTFQSDLLGNVDGYSGYYPSDTGKYYSFHFWLYSLSAVPIKWYLEAGNFDELKALQIANALFMIFALSAVLFCSSFSKYKKWFFSALVMFSPAVWYLGWPSPEVFSFSLMVAAIAFFSRKYFAMAILCASLAAAQNPPILVLTIIFMFYGLADSWRHKHYYRIPGRMAAALPAAAPMLFFYVNFGTANLIYQKGGSSFSVISLERTLSFFFDLNQGMLPYIPGILAFFLLILLRSWGKGNRNIYILVPAILVMVLLAQTTTNWNSDAEGMMRYAVWIVPLFIWGVVEGFDWSSRLDRSLMGTVLILQMIIVISFPFAFIEKREDLISPSGYVKHNVLASYVLDHFPYLYDPMPEIFVERSLKKEVGDDSFLPVIYFSKNGNVTKILTYLDGLENLKQSLDVDDAFIQQQRTEHASESGLVYLHPPAGKLRFVAQNDPLSDFLAEIKADPPTGPLEANSSFSLSVTVSNISKRSWFAEGRYQIGLSYHLYDESGELVSFNNGLDPIRHRIKPGEAATIPLKITTPAKPGIYIVEFDMVQDRVAWFKDRGSETLMMKLEFR